MGLLIAPRLISPRAAGAFASLALLTSLPTALFAAGTEAQREACTPDAFRLCATAMPDEKGVENCLRASAPRLSRACHDVFFPPEASAPDQLTRGQAPTRMRTLTPDGMQPPPPSMPGAPDDDSDN